MKSKKPNALPALAKGQLWKTENAQVEIMEVGKILTNYRFIQGQKRVATTSGRIQMVQDYLNKNGGVLIKNDRLVKTAA